MEGNDKKVINSIGLIILSVSLLAIGFMLGTLSSPSSSTAIGYLDEQTFNIFELFTEKVSDDPADIDMSLFWTIWNTLETEYVDEAKIDFRKMYYGAIKGMVNSYGDYATVFYEPEETAEYNDSNEGKLFEGIGAELGYDNGSIIVVTPLKGSPAEEAGLRSGDIILKVDGAEILPDESIYDVVDRIRGEAGTVVVLTIYSVSDLEIKDISITRRQITIPSITVEKASEINSNYPSDITVLTVARFTESSLSQWLKNWDSAIDEVVSQNPKGLIIDLRNNPGGYFDGAIYASEEFLPEGTLVSSQEDRESNKTNYLVSRTGNLLDIPVVILVNGGSASASEIFTGGLQLNDRAVVVGTQTYGKGTAQIVIPYSDGSSLHITIMKWLLPDGTWLNTENPIEPDVEVENTSESFLNGEDLQMNKALEEVKKI